MTTENIHVQVTTGGADAASKAIANVGNSAERSGQQVDTFNNFLGKMKLALATLGIGLTIQEIVGMADSFTHMQNQLRFAVENMSELREVQHKLFEISQETSTSFKDNVEIFSKLTQGGKQYQFTAQEMLQVTQTLAQAMDAAGAGSEEASGAIKALARSIASGEVNGRAMVQVFQSLPIVMRAIAEHKNAPLDALNELAAAGQLTGKDILEALQKSDLIVKAQAQKIDTISDGWTRVKNALVLYMGELNQAHGASQILVQTMTFLASNLDTIVKLLTTAIFTWAAYRSAVFVAAAATAFYTTVTTVMAGSQAAAALGVGALTTSLGFFRIAAMLAAAATGVLTGMVVALFTVIRAHPFVALVTAITTAIALIYQFGNSLMITDKISLLGALVGIWNLIKEGIVLAWQALQPFIGPIWETFKSVATSALNLIYTAIQKLLDALAMIFPNFKDAASSFSGWGAKIRKEMEEATASLKKTGDEAKDTGEKFTGAELTTRLAAEKMKKSASDVKSGMSDAGAGMKGYQDQVARTQRFSADLMRAMGNDVLAAGIVINEAWQHAADDPDAGIKAYYQRLRETEEASQRMMIAMAERTRQGHGKMHDDWAKGTKDLFEYQKELDAVAKLARNAMGEVVEAQDGWAARSGAAFNQMSEEVKNYAEDTITQTERIKNQYAKVEKSVQSATDAVHSFAGVADPRFSGIPPGMSKILMEAGIDVGDFQKLLVAQSIHYGHPGGARAQEDLFSYWSQMTAAQQSLLKRLGFGGFEGFASGGSFDVGGTGGVDSQLVQFMATPNERVVVQTPEQQRAEKRRERGGLTINMPVTFVTPNRDSFKASEPQIMRNLAARIARVGSRLPN